MQPRIRHTRVTERSGLLVRDRHAELVVADVEVHAQPLGEPPEHQHGWHGLLGLEPSHGRLLEAELRPELVLGSVSQVGSQVTRLALPLTAAIVLGATPAQMGALQAIETIPHVALGLVAGISVDRMRRRPVMIAADLGRPRCWARSRSPRRSACCESSRSTSCSR